MKEMTSNSKMATIRVENTTLAYRWFAGPDSKGTKGQEKRTDKEHTFLIILLTVSTRACWNLVNI